MASGSTSKTSGEAVDLTDLLVAPQGTRGGGPMAYQGRKQMHFQSSFSSVNDLVLFQKLKLDFEMMAKQFIIDKNPIDDRKINELIEKWRTLYIYIDTFYPEKIDADDIIDITKFNNFQNIMKKYYDILNPRDDHGKPIFFSESQLLTGFSGKSYGDIRNEYYSLLVPEIKHLIKYLKDLCEILNSIN